jgi:hypothetical protein
MMMKHFKLVILLFLLLRGSTYGQSLAVDEAVRNACICFSNLGKQEYLDVERNALDSCFRRGLHANLTGVLRELDLKFTTIDAGRIAAEHLQKKLFDSCQSYQTYLKHYVSDSLKLARTRYKTDTILLLSLNQNEAGAVFRTINQSNRIRKYYWLSEFDGSARFFNGIEATKFYWYEVKYQEAELYDSVLEQYLFKREIMLMDELEQIDKNSYNKIYSKQKKASK